MTEVKHIILCIAIFTVAISLVVIFVGCNDTVESIPEQCAEYTTAPEFNKCIQKHENRESLCSDVFWWLRYN